VSADRRVLYWIAGLFVSLYVLYLLADILLPFVAGTVLAYLLDPLADRLQRWKLPRWAAAGLITLIAVAAIIAAVLLLVPLLQSQLAGLAEHLPRLLDLLRDRLVDLLSRLQAELSQEQIEALREKLGGMAGDKVLPWIGGLLQRLWGGGVALLNLLSLLVITPIVLFYQLRDWDRIVAAVDSWLPRPHAPVIRDQFKEIDSVLSGFLRGQLSVCLLLGVFYAVGLTLVGLDSALIIGFLTGLISFIPYFGMLLGFAVGIGVALVQFDGWVPVAMVAGVFLAGQFIEGNFVTPRLVGSRVGLHPVWVIFALLAGGALFGFTGVLLAVPAAAVIGVLGRFALRRYRGSDAYLGGDGEKPGTGTGAGSPR
jgi:predicted PurR-regulated permease PerM